MRYLWTVIVVIFLSGCATQATQAQLNQVAFAVEAAWENDFQKLTEQYATRSYQVPKQDMMTAMQNALMSMEMIIGSKNSRTGTLVARSITPRPFNSAEWTQVVKSVLESMNRILAKELGPMSGVRTRFGAGMNELVFSFIFLEKAGSTLVSFTGTMNYVGGVSGPVAPIQAVPPVISRLFLTKMWSAFDSELESLGYKPKKPRDGLKAPSDSSI